MSSPPSKTTRIARRLADGSSTDDYWDESRRGWFRNAGTRYKSIAQAEAAIRRFKLDGRVVTHG